MKKLLCFILCILGFSSNSFANHIFGGELLYNHIHDSLYTVTLTTYGDCQSSSFTLLYSSTPIITIYRNGILYNTISLVMQNDSGTEVSPVCPGQINNTTCHSGGTLPGITKFTYSANITIPIQDTNWSFVFAGNFKSSYAGRSASITNVNNAGSSLVYLVATLNNTAGYNSSPAYTSIPTPYYCINVTQQYNQGANDIDGDSLSFSLISARDGNTGSPVTYISPYTYLNPLSADTFSFNVLNGQLIFKPNAIQDGLVVTQVSEYRKGVLVGTSMREMTFIVLNNCDNSPSQGTLENPVGGMVSGNIVTICQGTPKVSFDINVTDPESDRVKIIPNGVPANAYFSVSNDSTINPKISFSWNTDTLPVGIYNFYVTYKDNHCPIASSQTIAYTIKVISPYTIDPQVVQPTQCLHDAQILLNLSGGIIPRAVTVQQSGKTIQTFTDSTGIVNDNLSAGDYTILVSGGNAACAASYNFNVVDSGALPALSLPTINYCQYAPANQIVIQDSSTVHWYNVTMNPLSVGPTPSTATPGNYKWYFTRDYKVCKSGLDSVEVSVHSLPDVQIINIPATFCIGDKLYLQATGSMSYQWYATNNQLFNDRTNGYLYTVVMDTATYTVKGEDNFGCYDSSSATVSDVQPCCQIACPNAFTPNGDGRNDRYHIVTYGNMKTFELMIYNRWGQLVYISEDQHGSWDGTSHGIPCEIGTYYYMLKATCLTGHSVQEKGDITLIR